MAEQIASVTAVAVLVLATLLVPATCLLQNKRTTARQLALVYGLVILGVLAAVAMFIVDSHRYMRPAAVTLGFIALFIPVMTALSRRSRRSVKATDRRPSMTKKGLRD